MITKVFAIYDTKALCFGVPFFMPTVGGAVRAFADVANESTSTIYKHPTDYILFQVGEFDDDKGDLHNLLPNVNLGLASDFVVKKQFDRSFVPAEGVVQEMLEKPLAVNSELGGN